MLKNQSLVVELGNLLIFIHLILGKKEHFYVFLKLVLLISTFRDLFKFYRKEMALIRLSIFKL